MLGFNLAVTPVSDSIELNTRRETSETGEILIVDGVMKEEVAEERITKHLMLFLIKGIVSLCFQRQLVHSRLSIR